MPYGPLSVRLGGLNAIGIDQQDRLWTVDSDNNRIFMLPLTNDTKTAPRTPFYGCRSPNSSKTMLFFAPFEAF